MRKAEGSLEVEGLKGLVVDPCLRKWKAVHACSRSCLPCSRVKRGSSTEYRLFFHQKQEREAKFLWSRVDHAGEKNPTRRSQQKEARWKRLEEALSWAHRSPRTSVLIVTKLAIIIINERYKIISQKEYSFLSPLLSHCCPIVLPASNMQESETLAGEQGEVKVGTWTWSGSPPPHYRCLWDWSSTSWQCKEMAALSEVLSIKSA